MSHEIPVLIASYLEPDLVARIRRVDRRLKVLYEPELLRVPRYPADHNGEPVARSAEQERRWRELLAEAEVLFDFDQTHREDLPELAPKLRWVQGTSAGIGQFVAAMDYVRRLPETVFTTASGVHTQPLVEFCLMSMVMHNKGLLRLLREQANKHWERHAGRDLRGRTVLIVGVGSLGAEIARMCKALGMQVLGIKRRVAGVDPAALHLDELGGLDRLADLLPRAEYLVLVAPHTAETAGMLGTAELQRLPPGAFLINIGRGTLIDEAALVHALVSGPLGGASLDVFAKEPLPASSPLWELPNVLISPHSASTSERENDRLTDLFCDNLRRYLNGEELRNRFDPAGGY